MLYLGVYVPQIRHNRHTSQIQHLSLGMHFCLYFAYMLDLIYGFANNLPWQYQTVSIFGLSLLVLQHCQLLQRISHTKTHLFFLASTLMLIMGILKYACLSTPTLTFIGYSSRALFLFCLIPQGVKNHRQHTALAISSHYLYLSLILSLCDLISAWCLDWGWPNKLAPPLTMSVTLFLLRQIKHAQHQHRALKTPMNAKHRLIS